MDRFHTENINASKNRRFLESVKHGVPSPVFLCSELLCLFGFEKQDFVGRIIFTCLLLQNLNFDLVTLHNLMLRVLLLLALSAISFGATNPVPQTIQVDYSKVAADVRETIRGGSTMSKTDVLDDFEELLHQLGNNYRLSTAEKMKLVRTAGDALLPPSKINIKFHPQSNQHWTNANKAHDFHPGC
jgi:hypothetical protein